VTKQLEATSKDPRSRPAPATADCVLTPGRSRRRFLAPAGPVRLTAIRHPPTGQVGPASPGVGCTPPLFVSCRAMRSVTGTGWGERQVERTAWANKWRWRRRQTRHLRWRGIFVRRRATDLPHLTSAYRRTPKRPYRQRRNYLAAQLPPTITGRNRAKGGYNSCYQVENMACDVRRMAAAVWDPWYILQRITVRYRTERRGTGRYRRISMVCQLMDGWPHKSWRTMFGCEHALKGSADLVWGSVDIWRCSMFIRMMNHVIVAVDG